MFDSGISVKNLIEELKNTEVDIALDIPNATYVSWLNALQQLLYTEVIKEQREYRSEPEAQVENILFATGEEIGLFRLSRIKPSTKENKPMFEDIIAFYIDKTRLIKSSVDSGVVFPNTFFKYENDIGYNFNGLNDGTKERIIYYVKPALVKVDDNDVINDVNVMVPVEFIDLVKSKLRGEAYKLVNEDGIAAKWLNDYNVQLETFKAWINEKSPNFGL